jgi:hypothetical protein
MSRLISTQCTDLSARPQDAARRVPGVPVVALDRHVDELVAGRVDAERELDRGAAVLAERW